MHLGAVPRTTGTKTGLLVLRFEAFTQSAVEASWVVINRHFASVTVRQYWSSKLDRAAKGASLRTSGSWSSSRPYRSNDAA